MQAQKGDRIRLIYMPEDPHPVPAGTEGTVTYVNVLTYSENQIFVDWDDNRTLMLLEGIDIYEVIT